MKKIIKFESHDQISEEVQMSSKDIIQYNVDLLVKSDIKGMIFQPGESFFSDESSSITGLNLIFDSASGKIDEVCDDVPVYDSESSLEVISILVRFQLSSATSITLELSEPNPLSPKIKPILQKSIQRFNEACASQVVSG